MEPIRSTEELYAVALAMEEAAAHRYVALALRMHAQGERLLADLFWRLGRQEGEHYAALLRRIDEERILLPVATARIPEPPADFVTRLTTRRQALAIALDAERRSRDYFLFAARTTLDAGARALARELAEEEDTHIRLLLDEMRRPETEPARASAWDRLFVEKAA
jgi:rubrerythrin